jgi:hypothetical protein
MSALAVVHDIPGRLRLRFPAGVSADGAREALGAEPGVQTCVWSPRTRSLLVLYDRDRTSGSTIVEAVARFTGLGAAMPTARGTATIEAEPGGTLALGVREMFGDFDERLQRTTRGLIGLRGVLPAALAGWALTELIRGRAAPLAWSSALWYAHGLFRDYQLPGPRD